ncbi:MAG: hypothetical protein SGILL_007968 [Bacillariaceae sp.]
MLGVASCLILEYNGNLASILHAASVHCFAAQAIGLVVLDFDVIEEDEEEQQHDNENDNEGVLDDDDNDDEDPKKKLKTTASSSDNNTTSSHSDNVIWTRVGDACFLVGTLTDVFLSYFRIKESGGVSTAYASVVAATFWFVAAVIFLSIPVRQRCCRRHASRPQDSYDSSEDDSSILSSQENKTNNENDTTMDMNDEDEQDPTLEEYKAAKGLLDKSDEESAIVPPSPAPFDEVVGL